MDRHGHKSSRFGQRRRHGSQSDTQADLSLPCVHMAVDISEAHCGKRVVIEYANSKGSGEPARPRSLARTYAVRHGKTSAKKYTYGPAKGPGMRNERFDSTESPKSLFRATWLICSNCDLFYNVIGRPTRQIRNVPWRIVINSVSSGHDTWCDYKQSFSIKTCK